MDVELTQEQQNLRGMVMAFAQTKLAPIAADVDDSPQFPRVVFDLLRKEGFFRYLTPEEYGGVGISAVNLCIIREELSKICLKADELFTVQGLGSYPIVRFGTEAQKNRFLPSVATGERLFVFALTEPDAGSDVAALSMTAALEGDEYVVNGDKRFCASPDVADVYLMFAKTDPSQGGRGISALIVEGRPEGFEVSNLKLMGDNPTGEISIRDCRIPSSSLLGNLGEGMKIAFTNLGLFRVSVGAAAVGMAQAALDDSVKYAKKRVVFGKELSKHQVIQMKFADMAVKQHAARQLVYRAARLLDEQSDKANIEVPIAKLFATEAAQFIIDEALQIHGGIGLVKGVMVERLYRGVRALRIYEGASEIQRIIIARQLLGDK